MTAASMSEFRSLASEIGNRGRWGRNNELGTLNFIAEEHVREASASVRRGAMIPLGIDFGTRGARAGPHVRAASRWDTISHVYYDEQLHSGLPAGSATSAGEYRGGIDKNDGKGVAARGVLLDVAGHRGPDALLDPTAPVEPAELDAVAAAQGVTVRTGDVVLVRTGWASRFRRTRNPAEPFYGLGWRCAGWLHGHQIAAVAADNAMVENPVFGVTNGLLPLHRLCLRDMGMMFGEFWDLDALAADCAADGVYSFLLVAPSSRVAGAIGSAVNPIAFK